MCCCCPPAINALFCLWCQSGCSKGTVAGALTFFPPEPALYSFERVDSNGRPISDNQVVAASGGDVELKTEKMDRGSTKDVSDDTSSSNTSSGGKNKKKKMAKNKSKKSSKDDASTDENGESGNGNDARNCDPQQEQQVEVSHAEGEVDSEGNYHAREGQSREKVRSPAQQVTDRAKELRARAKQRNAQDQQDAKNGVQYKLHLDPRLQPPRFGGSGRRSGGSGGINDDECIQAVKIPCGRKQNGSSYCAAIVYKVPPELQTDKTFTIIYSHGNATDIGAMFPLQSILTHSLQCNVVSYDYSGYGESGGVAMESNTYTDIDGVYKWTLDNICNGDGSRIILYGQSVGSGPCCYLAARVKKPNELGGMILHSPFMSGMRVLTPSR